MGEAVTGDTVPDTDHVSRLFRNSQFDDNELQPSAFVLSPNDDDGLSVNWLEHASTSHRTALDAILAAARTKRTVKPNERFAVMNVGRALEEAHNKCPELAIEHDPESPPRTDWTDETHSLIKNMTSGNNMAVAEILAEIAAVTHQIREFATT